MFHQALTYCHALCATLILCVPASDPHTALQRVPKCDFWELTMDDVVNSSVRTEVMSWKRRELAAPDSRAPLLLSLMACSSPASRLMRMTLSALRQHVAVQPTPGVNPGSAQIPAQCANPSRTRCRVPCVRAITRNVLNAPGSQIAARQNIEGGCISSWQEKRHWASFGQKQGIRSWPCCGSLLALVTIMVDYGCQSCGS